MNSLLRHRETVNGRSCGEYEYDGVSALVYDDARTALKIIDLFADKEVIPEVKAEILPMILFPYPEDAAVAFCSRFWDAISEIIWDISGLDITGDRGEEGKRIFDWKLDEPYIRTTMLTAYGTSLDDLASRMTYKDLVGLIVMAPHETPMGQAIYYRTAKPPKRDRHNADYVKDFKKRQEFWKLDDPESKYDSMKAANDSATDAFNAFKNRAKG